MSWRIPDFAEIRQVLTEIYPDRPPAPFGGLGLPGCVCSECGQITLCVRVNIEEQFGWRVAIEEEHRCSCGIQYDFSYTVVGRDWNPGNRGRLMQDIASAREETFRQANRTAPFLWRDTVPVGNDLKASYDGRVANIRTNLNSDVFVKGRVQGELKLGPVKLGPVVDMMIQADKEFIDTALEVMDGIEEDPREETRTRFMYLSPDLFTVSYKGPDTLRITGLPFVPRIEDIIVVSCVTSGATYRYTPADSVMYLGADVNPPDFLLKIMGCIFRPEDEFRMDILGPPNANWVEADDVDYDPRTTKEMEEDAELMIERLQIGRVQTPDKLQIRKRAKRASSEREKEKLVERLTALGRRKLKP